VKASERYKVSKEHTGRQVNGTLKDAVETSGKKYSHKNSSQHE